MPRNEADPAFEHPGRAYWDLVSAVNGWFVTSLEDCQRLWHEHRKRRIPFMLQLNSGVTEKFAKGREAFAALDLGDWLRRADALGLSLYLNCGYPDWGRAPARATIALLRLGTIEGKPVFVLEGGNECDGATLDPDRLALFGSAAAPLSPRTVIYEFLREGYADAFSTAAGKLIDRQWQPREEALVAVREAFALALRPAPAEELLAVLDDVAALADSPELQAERRELARLGQSRPFVLLPSEDLRRLPEGTVLIVQGEARLRRLRAGLGARGVKVMSAAAVLAGQP
jgi:hypothetical protein